MANYSRKHDEGGTATVKGQLDGHKIDIFTVNPRITDAQSYWETTKRNIALSEKYNASGILLFSGNDTYADPWLVAGYIAQTTKSLIPFVALDPLTMPPYTAAKLINSLAYMYDRPTYLNWITGLS